MGSAESHCSVTTVLNVVELYETFHRHVKLKHDVNHAATPIRTSSIATKAQLSQRNRASSLCVDAENIFPIGPMYCLYRVISASM